MSDTLVLIFVLVIQFVLCGLSMILGSLLAFKLMRPGQVFWNDSVGSDTSGQGPGEVDNVDDDSEPRRSLDELLDS